MMSTIAKELGHKSWIESMVEDSRRNIVEH
jgi:hypothetical protein